MKKLLVGLALPLLLLPYVAGAFTGMGGENIVVSEAVADDLYLAGGSVTVQSDVEGDIHAAGGTVRIVGAVGGDVVAAGGDIKITGDVADDVRAFAGDVQIEGNIGDDLLVGSGTVVIAANAVVNGDLLVTGGQVEIWGTVKGDIKADAGSLGLYGVTEGSVKANVQDVRFSEKTQIAGDFIYHTGNENIEIDESLIGGKIEKIDIFAGIDKEYLEKSKGWSAKIGAKLFSLATNLLLGLFLVLLLPMLFQNSAKLAKSMPLPSLGLGIALYGGLVMAGLFLLITIIGVKASAFLFFAFCALLVVGKIFAGYFVGHLIFNPKKTLTALQGYGLFAVGLIVIELVKLIPYVGVLAVWIAAFMAIGGLLLAKHAMLKVLREKKML